MIINKDIIKFNTLVCLYLLFEKNKLISPLGVKLDRFGKFYLYEDKSFTFEKTKLSDITKIEKFSYRVKDMHSFLFNLVNDMLTLKNKSLNFLDAISLDLFSSVIKKNVTHQKFYKDLFEIINIIQDCKTKNVYNKISPKVYHILKHKKIKIIKVYLFAIYFLTCIKNNSIGENINFKIFITEPLIELKEPDNEI